MTPAMLEVKEGGRVVGTTCELEIALRAFNEAIENHKYLEIDGDIEGKDLSTHRLVILNHDKEVAYSITLEAVLNQETAALIQALETGINNRLYGITRIVGYYSRISNWNKSKIGELQDRHRGRYSVKAVA